MKKYYFIIAALFAIAAVSCQKETAAPDEGLNGGETIEPAAPASGKTMVFTASLPEVAASRTQIGAPDGSCDYVPLW